MKASLTPVIPQGDPIWLEYNPPELETSQEIEWAQINIPGLNWPLQQFIRGGVKTLNLEVYFNADSYNSTFDVRSAVDKLEALTQKGQGSLSPAVCLFSWGDWQFPCLVASINTRYTMFDKEGKLLEAAVKLVLRAYKEPDVEAAVSAVQAKLKTSPVYSGRMGSNSVFAAKDEGGLAQAQALGTSGETKLHTVQDGESTRAIAAKEHGNPACWRAVEFINQARGLYDKARDIKSGIELMIPDPRQPLGIIQRVTNFPPETMESLYIGQKIGMEGVERQFKPSLGVWEK